MVQVGRAADERLVGTTRPGDVPRVRLLDLLMSAPAPPIVVLSAPAGAGKTVLTAQWAAADRSRRHVVVRVAAYEDDPSSLAEHVLRALGDLGGSTSEALAVATGAEPRFSGTLLPALSEVVRTRDAPFVLVIDDVHLLRDPRCAQVLGQLADAVPLGSTLCLATRGQPPAWLARRIAEGRVLELGPADLAFRADELSRLAHSLGLHLDARTRQLLLEHTEGWAVGLRLALMRLAQTGSQQRLLDELDQLGSGELVGDYLRSEVLDQLDDADRTFLRRTSILGDLTAEACDALLARDDSASTLHRLTRSVQLISPPPTWDGTYRPHHLLAEAMRADLVENEPSAVRGLHAGAAEWYWRQSLPDDAVRHATSAHRVDLAERYISEAMASVLSTGKADRLSAWLSLVPEPDVRASRRLTLAAAWAALMGGDGPTFDAWIAHAEAQLGPTWTERAATDQDAAMLGVLAVIAGRDGVEQSLELAEDVIIGLPADSPYLSAVLGLASMQAALLGRDEDAHAFSENGLRLARATGAHPVVADNLSWRALTALMAGDTQSASRLVAETAALTREYHLDRLATSGMSLTVQALERACTGHHEEATRLLGTGRRLSALMGGVIPWWRTLGPAVQARTNLVLGDLDGARALMAEAERNLTPDLARTWIPERVALIRGELRGAARSGTAGSRPSLPSLTKAELRVLQFLPTHLTIPQVAAELVVSANTVKSHALSIYRKLDVTSRDDAVRRARQLGLVESVPASQ